MAPAMSPMDVTIPNENATAGSKMLFIPDIPPNPAWIVENPPPAFHTNGRITAPIPKIIMSCMKSVRIEALRPEIRVYERAMTSRIGMTVCSEMPVSSETKLPPAKSCTVTAISW